jgi:prepilin-type N-terminal cleavage/methylation domain-containing protein
MDRGAHIGGLGSAARRRRGLTLIEVLAVVAILALLVAILLPSLAAARQKARRLACASNLRAVGRALNLYRIESGKYPSLGDRDPGRVFSSSWRPGDPRLYRSVVALNAIGDVAEALVYASLGDPWAMYCPTSLQADSRAPKPYARAKWNGQLIETWRVGHISYMYLVGLDYEQAESTFPDASGQPTFNPATESPERRVNHVNPRAVLAGDCAVEIVPPNRNIPGSNHGREGGWFLFTSGDVQWWGWDRLTAHPTSIYVWYWPRVVRPFPS